MKYEKLVEDILKNIGGKDNILSLTHCITRLRFKLKNEKICNTEILKNTPGIVTIIQSGGQYQVVIGNHVPDVYKEFLNISGMCIEASISVKSSKSSIFDQAIDILSGIFQPILGVLCATGMIKGFLALLTTFSILSPTSGTYIILYTVADSLFYFFPIFLGFTAARKFGLNQFLGMAIGAAMVYPTIGEAMGGEALSVLFEKSILQSDIYLTFLGIPVILPMGTYASTVIPVIFSVVVAAPLERWLNKVIPDVVKNFLTPFFTLLIVIPLSFLIIGPIASWLGNILGASIIWLYNLSPIVTGLILGAIWQVLVIFGLHWGIVTVAIFNIATFGFDSILILIFTASFAQIGVVGAIYIKTKNKELKSLTIPAFISGIFGVTEPSIYGITLPRKKTFIASCIGASVGGTILGAVGAKSYIIGGLGIFGYPNVINPNGIENYIIQSIASTFIAFGVAFIIGYIVYKDEEGSSDKDNLNENSPKLINSNTIYSPMKGDIVPLEKVEDAAFSSGAIGKGVAIKPTDGKVYAPVDGVVSTLLETKHAIGIVCDSGTELIIHIGMDTVHLKGKFFNTFIKQGDRVKKGQLIKEVNLEGIKKAGYSTTTPVVVTNYFDYVDVVGTDKKSVIPQDELIYLTNEISKT